MEDNIGKDIIGNGINVDGDRDLGDGNCLGTNGNAGNGNSEDQGDALGKSRFTYGDLTAPMPVSKYASHYKMDHPKRGIALIFNHEKFETPHLRPRAGTAEDCKNLKECLKNLGFDVQVFQDLRRNEIEEHIQGASKVNHVNYDCIIVAVLSHGEQGIIYARDTHYKPEMLWSYFTPEKCITLAGKPKIFFLQACQGDRLDAGVTLATTETDGEVVSTYKIPQQADFLMVYSTVKGYYSWRNTTKGSWFVQALCKELRERAFSNDLMTLLTFVSQRVAFDFESNVPDSPTMHRQKQVPCIVSMLTRLIQFTKTGSEMSSQSAHVFLDELGKKK
uniref:Caspase-1 n=1 Tax=Dastarcus helophoroides TaxID=1169899 RepID=A0A067ZT52_9CUCU|nr:caspase-1 [Dastarcus helophoroides]